MKAGGNHNVEGGEKVLTSGIPVYSCARRHP